MTAPISGAAPLKPSVMPGIATPRLLGPLADSVASGVAMYWITCVAPSVTALTNGFATVTTSWAMRCDEPNSGVTALAARPVLAAPMVPHDPPEFVHQVEAFGNHAL